MDSYDVLIVGSGPVGLSVGKFLKAFKLAFVFPRESINFSTRSHDGDFKLSSDSKTGSFGGNGNFWANQHDIEIKVHGVPNRFSDLSAFPFPIDQLEVFQSAAAKLGWPNPSTSKRMLQNLTLAFSTTYIVKLRNSIPRKCKYSRAEKIPCQYLELLEKDSVGNYLIKVDEKIISTKFLVFASGGISNIYFVKSALEIFYPNINVSNSFLGKGFTGHPKFTAAKISTEKFFKFRKRIPKGYLIPTYRLSESANFRFLPSMNIAGKETALDKILRKFGYSRNFQVMVYLEPAQLSRNCLKINAVSRSEIEVSANYSFDENELSAFELSIKTLIESLRSNPNIRRIREEIYHRDILKLDQHHYFGTTRMGVDHKFSVVDHFGKVHETEGIYVAGTSVLPLSRAEHPTYLAILVALRTANHIRNRLLNGCP